MRRANEINRSTEIVRKGQNSKTTSFQELFCIDNKELYEKILHFRGRLPQVVPILDNQQYQ
jgi:hypothetical protein